MVMDDNSFMIERWAQKTPEKIAVYDDAGQMSYGELAQRIDVCAGELYLRGIRKGDRVLLSGSNRIQFVIAFFAILRLGAICAVASPQYEAEEITCVSCMTEPKLILTDSQEKWGAVKNTVSGVETAPLGFEGSARSVHEAAFPALKPDTPALIVSTSGSSGRAKGVLLTRRNLIFPAQDIMERFHMTEKDVSFVPVPLVHMFGIMGMLVNFLSGGTMVTTAKFNGKQALEKIQTYGVSVQYCVPTMYAKEIMEYEKTPLKLHTLRTGMIAGAPSVKQYITWFDEQFGCRLLNAYGLTEASALAMVDWNDPKEVRYETAGRPCRGVELQIQAGNGQILPVGTAGEILCRSGGVMSEYYHNRERTKAAFTEDGWFHTGDIGVIDERGCLTVTGRKKDMIIRGGYNVFPAEIEEVLLQLREVQEVCVIGHPDSYWGEIIIAVVSPAAGSRITAETVTDYARKHLAHYKVPDGIVFVSSLPKLPTGKYDKTTLKRELERGTLKWN